MRTELWRRRAVLLLPAALAARCASSPPPKPTLDLTLIGGADQNADASGQPTPVAVRIYQLAGAGAFDQADVFALSEQETKTLGADDLGMEQVLLALGERRQLSHELKKDTGYIGCIVLFRDIDRATWRAKAAVAEGGPTRLTLRTKGITAALTNG